MSEGITELYHAIAKANGFEVYTTYKEPQAAKLLSLSLSTLSRIRSRGEIGFIQKSERRIDYFGFHLVQYLLAQQRCPDTPPQKDLSNLETISSASERTGQAHGSAHGLIPRHDKRSASALARQTMTNVRSS